MKNILFFLFVCFYAVSANAFYMKGKVLTCKEAEQVLRLVAKHEGYDLSKEGMFIDDCLPGYDRPRFFPGYHTFGIGYDTPEAAATRMLGMYAISELTGDAWEVHLCERYSFKELNQVQKKIMRKTGKNFTDEKESRKGLGCTDE